MNSKELEKTSDTGLRRLLARTSVQYVLVLLAAGVMYVATAAPSVVWQDSGVHQWRLLQKDPIGPWGLALSHPLFHYAARAVDTIPLGETAFHATLTAGIFAALTVANIMLLARAFGCGSLASLLAATSLAVAHTFWRHATIAETYTLTTFLLSIELLCIAQYYKKPSPRWLVLLFFVNGLGISNHMLAALGGICYAIWLAVLLIKRRLSAAVLPLVLLAHLAGASLYLSLIITDIYGGATLGEAIRSALFGTHWQKNVLNTRITMGQFRDAATFIIYNFPSPALPLAVVGVRQAWRKLPRGLATLLLAVALTFFGFAFRYSIKDKYSFFMPLYPLIAVFAGLGTQWLTQQAKSRAVATAALALVAVMPIGVYLLAPVLMRQVGMPLPVKRTIPYRDNYDYFLRPWRCGYRGSIRYGRQALSVPAGSAILADTTVVPVLLYLQQQEMLGRDVLVQDFNADLHTPNRPATPIHSPEQLEPLLKRGPVFVSSNQVGYCPPWLLESFRLRKTGVLFRVLGRRETTPRRTRS